jgi:hypothetical protein
VRGEQDTDVQWYIVQTAQVLFMHKHFSAFRNGVLRFSILTGPGEALFAFNIVPPRSSTRVSCVFLADPRTHTASTTTRSRL